MNRREKKLQELNQQLSLAKIAYQVAWQQQDKHLIKHGAKLIALIETRIGKVERGIS